MIVQDLAGFFGLVAQVGPVSIAMQLDEIDVIFSKASGGYLKRLDAKPPVAPGKLQPLGWVWILAAKLEEAPDDLPVFLLKGLRFHFPSPDRAGYHCFTRVVTRVNYRAKNKNVNRLYCFTIKGVEKKRPSQGRKSLRRARLFYEINWL